MRRGLLFTLAYLALFLLLLAATIAHRQGIYRSESGALAARAPLRLSESFDDLASDARDVLYVRNVTLNGTSVNKTLTVVDRLPHALADPAGALATWQTFVNTTYRQKLNLNASSANASTLNSTARLVWSGANLTYRWVNASNLPSLNKTQARVSGHALVAGYELVVYDWANLTFTGCATPPACGAGCTLAYRFEARRYDGSALCSSTSPVNPAVYTSFNVTANGSTVVEAWVGSDGIEPPASHRVALGNHTNPRAEVTLAITVNTTNETAAYLEVGARADDATTPTLVLARG
jgi:hypothetical protein